MAPIFADSKKTALSSPQSADCPFVTPVHIFILRYLASRRAHDFCSILWAPCTSGDGHISAKELGKVMKKLGRRMSHADLINMIDEFDADKSGLRCIARSIKL